MAKLLTAADFASSGKLLSEEDLNQTPKLLTAEDLAADTPKVLSEADFAPTPKPAQEPGFLDELKSDVKEAGQFWGDVAEGVGMMFTPSGQQELLSDPKTAGAAGAVIGTSAFFVPGADTPIAETERENRFKAQQQGIEYTPQGPVDPLVAESVGGALGRIGISGPLAPIVEAGGKVAEIAAQEPEEDLTSLKTAGRAALTGGLTYLPMKGGAMAERAIGQLGLGKLATFGANAGADLALGYTSGVGMTAGEKAMTGQEITAADFKPSAIDVVGAGAAGLGGLRGNAARNAEIARANEPVTTPERIAEIEQSLQDEIQGVKSLAHDRLVNRLDREYEADVAAEMDTQAQRIGNTRAIDDGPKQEVLALPAPEGKFTAGRNPGVLGLSPLTKTKGATDGLQQREVQGETASGPRINQESQEIAATPEPQAGMGVINLAGDQGAPAAPGRPIGGLGLSAIPQAARSGFNPKLGELKTSTLDPATEQVVNDTSYANEAELQQARRGSVPVKDTIDAATKLAESKGYDVVQNWKPGEALNAEKLASVKAYTGGVNRKLTEIETEYEKTLDPKLREIRDDLRTKRFAAVEAMVGTKSEAGRALNILRYSIAPAKYSTPEAVAASKQPNKITQDDKTAAAEYLTKVYKNKPVPENVQRELDNIKPDDVGGMAAFLKKQTQINNKTSPHQAFINFVKAGMLTSLRTLERNVGGLQAKVWKEQAADQIGALADWAMSGVNGGPRTRVGLSPKLYVKDSVKAWKEGVKEGLDMMRGKYSSEIARAELDKFEFGRDQYTGDTKFNKALDLYSNSVFRLTGAVDLPFRKKFFYKNITDNAKLTAVNEAREGIIPKSDIGKRMEQLRENPTPEMIADAMVYAEEMVYADKNAAASGIKSGIGVATGMLRKKGMDGAANTVEIAEASTTPFLKVPFNITWDVLKTSILDSAKVYDQFPDVARLMLKGELTPEQQKAFTRAVGNGGIGAGAMIAGAMLYMNGRATGSYEQENSNVKQTNEMANRYPGSLKIGDNWYRIQDIASPVSNLMVLGATLAREWTEPEEEGSVGVAVANTVVDNPFFKGVKEIAEIPDRGFQNFAAGRAGMLVPAFVSDTASLFDDKQRETRKQEGENSIDVVAKKVKSRLPGLRNTLQPKVSGFGDEMPESKWGIINATFPKDAVENNNKSIREMLRLNVGPSKPERFYDEKTKKFTETEEQFLKRAKERGAMLEKVVDTVVNKPNYDGMSEENKKKLLQQVLTRYNVNAKNR